MYDDLFSDPVFQELDYNSTDQQKETNKKDEKEMVAIPYEDKYLAKYKELKIAELSEDMLKAFATSFIIEVTPVGNVLMFYDHQRETFVFYADSQVPYRYLETVSRRYAIMNNCKLIHVDMQEQLEECRAANEARDTKKLDDLELEGDENDEPSYVVLPPKKSVFASLKKYNTKSSIHSAKAPQTSTVKADDPKMLLKSKANRYTCEGKFCNFPILKKVPKKAHNLNCDMSFAEYKKFISLKK